MNAWQTAAACADHGEPDLWHPVEFSPNDREFAIRAAKEICAGCPVRTECLNEALTKGYEGIWGGTTDHERATMLGRTVKPEPTPDARCGTYAGNSRHLKRGEQSCVPCRAAANAYDRQLRARKREAASA